MEDPNNWVVWVSIGGGIVGMLGAITTTYMLFYKAPSERKRTDSESIQAIADASESVATGARVSSEVMQNALAALIAKDKARDESDKRRAQEYADREKARDEQESQRAQEYADREKARDEREQLREKGEIEKERLRYEEIKKVNGKNKKLTSKQMVSQRLIEEQRREILAYQDWAERLSHQVMSYRGVPVLFKPDLIGGESVELPPGVAP